MSASEGTKNNGLRAPTATSDIATHEHTSRTYHMYHCPSVTQHIGYLYIYLRGLSKNLTPRKPNTCNTPEDLAASGGNHTRNCSVNFVKIRVSDVRNDEPVLLHYGIIPKEDMCSIRHLHIFSWLKKSAGSIKTGQELRVTHCPYMSSATFTIPNPFPVWPMLLYWWGNRASG